MHIVVVGLSHRTAPVEVREKLSIPDQSITESLKALKAFSDVLEAVSYTHLTLPTTVDV